MRQPSSHLPKNPSISDLERQIVEALEIADNFGLTLVGCRLDEALTALRAPGYASGGK